MLNGFVISAALALVLGIRLDAASLPNAQMDRVIPQIGAVQEVALKTPASILQGRLAIDGRIGGTMEPGKPANWTFSFTDSRIGRPVTEFELEHEKYMHMIVVSEDLSTFAHVHPAFDPASGRFTARVNEAISDPDNRDLLRAVPKAGRYFVFGEVRPRGMPLQKVAFTVQADGAANPAPVTPDPTSVSGKIEKYFTADGEPGHPGDAYKVTLTLDSDSMPGMVHLVFNIQAAMRHGNHVMYHDVTDLVPWLGMIGHAILTSRAGDLIEDKVFLHLHAGHHDHPHADGGHHHPGGHDGHGGDTGPDVTYMLMGGDIPPNGVYKIWAQVKREGRVLTFPFVFEFSR